ncbi:hypothetical protein PHLCEN_2v3359 [Hermanssonia centrifuga]|uniref:Uncharacterized protein n=1 Tax=Hermanssonia centrifuga TaxID=98765 RepID=A0A2R6QM37_9APHY|nr:hypothetical protein PHLCEN_2v3359 [Hermanssonia centrifuga]
MEFSQESEPSTPTLSGASQCHPSHIPPPEPDQSSFQQPFSLTAPWVVAELHPPYRPEEPYFDMTSVSRVSSLDSALTRGNDPPDIPKDPHFNIASASGVTFRLACPHLYGDDTPHSSSEPCFSIAPDADVLGLLTLLAHCDGPILEQQKTLTRAEVQCKLEEREPELELKVEDDEPISETQEAASPPHSGLKTYRSGPFDTYGCWS